MEFYSTNDFNNRQPLHEAVLRSLPSDRGLYMPDKIEPLPESFWQEWRELSFAELSSRVAQHFFRDSLPSEVLEPMVRDAINFAAPLHKIDDRLSVLELFHGPTLAFKDFGARFMARLMGYLTREDERTLTVLVATSGDTGGAVASAFYKVPGTRVVILYPSGKVSALQEKQLTTLGENITALEIDGSFDDCQRLVKTAFADRVLNESLNLTSANSINISRLLPQSFYYFEAARQLPEGQLPAFVVPSGNFGNLTAGVLAHQMGLPVASFVAATNVNDVVPRYLADGTYQPRETQATLSNAMDVGDPSNFARLLDLYSSEKGLNQRRERASEAHQAFHAALTAYCYDDEATRQAIRKVWDEYQYAICPHTAIGYLAARQAEAKLSSSAHAIVLATAHPAKFLPTMESELGEDATPVPERLACLADKPAESIKMSAEEEPFLEWLRELS